MAREQRDEGFVGEYYRLAGYEVIPNLRLKSAGVGGRDEGDIVALRLDCTNKTLDINHVEVGQLSRKFEDTKKMILKKFNERHQEALLNIVKHRYNLDDTYAISYVPTYIYSYCSKRNIKKLEPLLLEAGIRFKSLTSLYGDLPRLFEEYKQRIKQQGLVKTDSSNLPIECDRIYHLMKYMEYMESI